MCYGRLRIKTNNKSTKNQYNEDEEEIESWNQIVNIFEGVLDTFYSKLEEAKSKQPEPDW